MRRFLLLVLMLSLSNIAFSQNLLTEPIRKIGKRKKSVYVDRGIFHNGVKKVNSNLKALRHSFKKKSGYERLVFDFGTKEVPRIYGFFSRKEKKLYIDFFDTQLKGNVKSFGNSKYVKAVEFFPLAQKTLSAEIKFKNQISLDMFYLAGPGRLVVDIKN